MLGSLQNGDKHKTFMLGFIQEALVERRESSPHSKVQEKTPMKDNRGSTHPADSTEPASEVSPPWDTGI